MAFDSAKRVMSGTWGEVWWDGNYVSECYGCTAKFSYNKETIARCGQMAQDSKVTSVSGTGTLKMHKVNSRMVLAMGEAIRNGRDIRFTIISKLADPDAYGAERVSIKNVSMDELTLADWEVGVAGKIETNFTFTDYDLLDSVSA